MSTENPATGCMLCAAVHMVPGQRAPGAGPARVVAYVDSSVVALVDPQLPGAVLAPRAHVAMLSTVPTSSGTVLAALRRAAGVVQGWFQTSGTMVEPAAHLEGSDGHVCYLLVPTRQNGSPPLTPLDAGVAVRSRSRALGQPFGPPDAASGSAVSGGASSGPA